MPNIASQAGEESLEPLRLEKAIGVRSDSLIMNEDVNVIRHQTCCKNRRVEFL